MPAHDSLRSYDGEGLASVRKQPADPAQHQPVCSLEWQSGWSTSAQNSDLLPKHEYFCFQRRPRSKQIDDETNINLRRPTIRHSVARFSGHANRIQFTTGTGTS